MKFVHALHPLYLLASYHKYKEQEQILDETTPRYVFCGGQNCHVSERFGFWPLFKTPAALFSARSPTTPNALSMQQHRLDPGGPQRSQL